ncbi:MAG: hypothetical protein RSC29_00480 [Oscillospiraceae bacterium]
MKVFKATINFYLYHIIGIVISIVLIFPLIKLVTENPIWFSVITTVVYMMMMYSIAWNIGNLDARKIPGYFPNYKLPLYITGFTLIIPVALFIYRIGFNAPFEGGNEFMRELINGKYTLMLGGNHTSGLADFIYKMWFFPFEGFLGNNNMLLYTLVLFILPVLINIGYAVGLKRFSIMGKLMGSLVYKKKVEERRQKAAKANSKSRL